MCFYFLYFADVKALQQDLLIVNRFKRKKILKNKIFTFFIFCSFSKLKSLDLVYKNNKKKNFFFTIFFSSLFNGLLSFKHLLNVQKKKKFFFLSFLKV